MNLLTIRRLFVVDSDTKQKGFEIINQNQPDAIEVMPAIVDEYNASQGEVNVNATFQGNYYENHAKIMSAIARVINRM